MVVTELGMLIDVNEEHMAKAELSIEVTVDGSVIELKRQQPEKAFSPMLVNPVKYCNSLNVTLVPCTWKASWNTSPRLVTAAASA